MIVFYKMLLKFYMIAGQTAYIYFVFNIHQHLPLCTNYFHNGCFNMIQLIIFGSSLPYVNFIVKYKIPENICVFGNKKKNLPCSL